MVRNIACIVDASYQRSNMEIVKPADETTQHKNHRVWSVATGEEVISFVQKSMDNW